MSVPLLAVSATWIGCGQNDSSPAAAAPDPGDDDETEPPDESLGDDASVPPPIPDDDAGAQIPTKIRYVIVLVKENHTFDNYFTGFPGAESSMKAKASNGTMVTRPVAPTGPLPSDICHANTCGQRAYANGAMNGFDTSSAGQLSFVRYTEQQIPNYWQYARNFVLADHMFSTTLSQSAPGHEVFWFARSLTLDNPKCGTPDGGGCAGYGCLDPRNVGTSFDPDKCTTKTAPACFDGPVLPDHLPPGFTWVDYGGAMATMSKTVTSDPNYKTHFRSAGSLVSDLSTGHLANLTIAHLSGGETSEHPKSYPCAGENLSVDIVNAAMKLPQWNEMAIIITWDDWGGFYDHVPPPVHKCANGQIFQNGFRLPLILISPYAKKGFVLNTPTEQASVPKLVEELWGIPFMSTREPHARDGMAGSLMASFDFNQTPRAPLFLQKHTCP